MDEDTAVLLDEGHSRVLGKGSASIRTSDVHRPLGIGAPFELPPA